VPVVAARGLRNRNRTGLVQIVGQVQASDRDSQSKCWAKSHNLGRPCETHLRQRRIHLHADNGDLGGVGDDGRRRARGQSAADLLQEGQALARGESVIKC
jgi:hypothetical protein